MSRIVLTHIKQLLQVQYDAPSAVRASQMRDLPLIENAWLAIEDGLISAFGSMNDWEGISDWRDLEVINCEGKIVMPGFVDSHTHLVFASSRENEFNDRIKGLSYEEIAARGGGILNSVDKLRDTSEDELYASAKERLAELIAQGTTAIEIKSGYGLSLDSELKILRVVKRLSEEHPISISSTLLAAHAVPREYSGNKEAYLQHIIDDIIPMVAREKLAEFCDVFCERNYFTPEETRRILVAGIENGLRPKIHANQLSRSGGVQVGTDLNAISVDHLEYLEEEEIRALAGSQTVATLLPGAQFFLQLPYPPARRLIDAGAIVALASDFNPGSSPTGNMKLMMSLACVQYKMTVEESINATTINGAFALGRNQQYGSITPGLEANIIITKPMDHYHQIPYYFGSDFIEEVRIKGIKMGLSPQYHT